MAKKKHNITGIDQITKALSETDLLYVNTLHELYNTALAATVDENSTQLKRFNYMGLFDIGIRDKEHKVVQKLSPFLDDIRVRHLIVAHGYIVARF